MYRIQLPRSATLALFDLFVLLGLLGLNLKTTLMDSPWAELGLFVGMPLGYRFTFAEQVGFYATDIAINLLLVPLVLTALISLVFRRHRVAAGVVVALVLVLLYFLQQRALHEVGQFLSRDLIMDALRWGTADPGSLGAYLTPLSALKLLLLLVGIAAIALIARRARRNEAAGRGTRAQQLLLLAPALAVCVPAVVLVLIGLPNRHPELAASHSAIGRVVATMARSDGAAGDGLGAIAPGQQLQTMRNVTRTPPFDPSQPEVGSERGADVLLFVMETGPARGLDLASEGASLPGTGQLFAHSFIAEEHYTSYPYTSDALYSMLTGRYPQGRRRLLRDPRVTDIGGLMEALSGEVPVRHIYMPSLYFNETDDRLFSTSGGDGMYVADAHPDDPLRASVSARVATMMSGFARAGAQWNEEEEDRLRRVLTNDLLALQTMKTDIRNAVREHKRYVMMYLPQIGHGPWLPLRAGSLALDRGRDLMHLQDQWLAELVDTIRDAGRLDDTLIVVTADHGVRARSEDPSIVVGKIDDYMFRVPMLIYAPRALAHTRFIDVPSSHIDVAPTLLALLGNTTALTGMEGTPLWQRRRDQRIYLYANAYGGADGYVEDGNYFMFQSMWDAVYESPRFSFDVDDRLPQDDPRVLDVEHAIGASNRLQESFATELIHRNRGVTPRRTSNTPVAAGAVPAAAQ